MHGRLPPPWIGAVLPLTLLTAAQLWAWAVELDSYSLASPVQTAKAFQATLLDGSLLLATMQTLGAAFGGLALGCAAGCTIGIVAALSRTIDRLLVVPTEVLRPIPVVALIPVFMLVFGLGYPMEITLVAIATAWPMLLLTRSAILGVEPRLMEVAQVLGLGLAARVRKIILPAVLPRLFVAFRLSLGIALIVAVTVEIAANPMGIGFGMMSAAHSLRPEIMFAFLIWLAVVGWALNRILLAIQTWLLPEASA